MVYDENFRRAARLFTESGATDAGGGDPRRLVSVLRDNQVPLLWLEQVGPGSPAARLLEDAGAREAVERERRFLAELRSQYLEVKELLAGARIDTMFVKAVDLAPTYPYTCGNQDIAVPLHRFAEAQAILAEHGHVELRHVNERNKVLFRTFRGGHEAISVHLHSHVSWEGIVFVDPGPLWERSRPSAFDPELRVPSDEDALVITVSHAFDENKVVKLADLLKLRFLMGRGPLDWDLMFDAGRRHGWAFQLDAILSICDRLHDDAYDAPLLPPEVRSAIDRRLTGRRLGRPYLDRLFERTERTWPFPIPFWYSKGLNYVKMVRDPSLGWRQRLYDVVTVTPRAIARKLRLRTQPAMLIVASGIDGSGKTTLTESIDRCFTLSEVRTRRVWVRCGELDFVRRLKGWLGRRLATRELRPEEREAVDQGRRRYRLLRGRWSRLAYVASVAGELVGWALYVRWLLLRGKVVICDRYWTDTLAELSILLGSARLRRGVLAWLERTVFPTPDVWLWLDVPVGTVLERRADESDPVELEQRRSALTELMRRQRPRRIDATRPLAEVVDPVIHGLLRRYSEGHVTFVNGLFLHNPKRREIGIARWEGRG